MIHASNAYFQFFTMLLNNNATILLSFDQFCIAFRYATIKRIKT